MMQPINFQDALEQICSRDPRYAPPAYLFVKEGLDYTVTKLKRKPNKTRARHVTGQELADGLRQHALKEFGPIAKLVLNRWGIFDTRDFGEIVFNMVNCGIMGKTKEDSIDDFSNCYTFEKVFVQPYLPRAEQTLHPANQDHPDA